MPLYENVIDLAAQAARLRARRHGMIEVVAGRLVRVRLRPWMRRASLVEIKTLGRWQHHGRAIDRCRLYYTQPRAMPTYLAVTYAISGRGATLASVRGALVVLDEIARLRKVDALLCDLGNARISDRLATRWGWARLDPSRRQYIKRFYGRYPPPDPLLHALCAGERPAASDESPICTHTQPSRSLTG